MEPQQQAFEPVYSDHTQPRSPFPQPVSNSKPHPKITLADISCQPMSLFLAIDAGGTKTRCLLADETAILGRAVTGSVKLMRVGEAEASARLQAMLAEVSLKSRVDLSKVTQTCIGLAGLTIDAVREWAEREIRSLVGGNLLLAGDEEIALDGAFRGGPGILVIAGTGSNVMGRAADGTMYRAGGWGPAIGDEGSGFWIGQEALRAGFWAKDRDIATTLLAEIGDSGAQTPSAKSSRWPTLAPAPTFPRSPPSSLAAQMPATNSQPQSSNAPASN